jgi:hypothetical protein
MELTRSSETLAYKNLTLGKFPKDYILQEILNFLSSLAYKVSVRVLNSIYEEKFFFLLSTWKILTILNVMGITNLLISVSLFGTINRKSGMMNFDWGC